MRNDGREQLKEEWGVERYVKALGILVSWLLVIQHPISTEQMNDLQTQSSDAFELFKLRMLKI